MTYIILLLDNTGIDQSEGYGEESQKILEIQLPYLWTQHKNQQKKEVC